MAAVIDSHQHFWRYSREEYAWIDERKQGIARSFSPEDLKAAMDQAGVDRSIAVQARQSLAETSWLAELAAAHPFICAVVGWVPLLSTAVGEEVGRVLSPKLKAVRHVLQDEPDDGYMLREDFNRGIAVLRKFELVYDILIYERQLAPAIELVDRHPNQVFVLDHVAKPRIAGAELSPWREQIKELSRRENVYCKVSGMVTEADWSTWTEGSLQPYFDAVFEAFTPRRLMFGSDWPVVTLASTYGGWVEVLRRVTASFSAVEKERFWGGTAIEAYRL